jgi:acetate---CoA ligase (ADP-forming)
VDLSRLYRPASIAVVGASERSGSYSSQTLENLDAFGYEGAVYGVNPKRTEVHGRPCFPSLSELPEPADAVVVAIPAAGVAEVIEEAGRTGCRSAVVYSAGFAEVEGGREYQEALVAAAARHALPVCGPNGNGIVALGSRAALWGDALRPQEPGHVALVSQSGNVAVNALNTTRGLRFHSVTSCGNQAVLDAADYIEFLAGENGVHSIALYLEDDGDGARLCKALATCADAGVRVAVLKVGTSSAGATAAAAHTGALAGDQRVFRALVEEAGAAWAGDVHELLELAKALAVPQAVRPGGRLAILTCSGGDSSLGADEASRLGIDLPAFDPDTRARLAEQLPTAATIANPLDYTAMIWGDAPALAELVRTVGEDPNVDGVLVFYDQPADLEGAVEESWRAVRDGIEAGAALSPVPTMVASTLPELLDDAAAWKFARAGVPAVAGLRTGLVCAAALGTAGADPARLREIAAVCDSGEPAAWVAEHEAKELLAERGVATVEGVVVSSEDAALAAFRRFGGPVAAKLSSPEVRHKSELSALELGIADEESLAAAYRRLAAMDSSVLVERMASPGVELLVAARRDAVVPALVLALGGIWTELLDDVAIVPLPATPARVEQAIRGLRAAPLLTGGRGRTPLDVPAVAQLAAATGDALLALDAELIELNPVLVHESGAVAVDATMRLRNSEVSPKLHGKRAGSMTPAQ